MNKKFSTLMAGLLLSGSAFAAHQAGVDWTTGLPGALDNVDKYWQISTVNYRSGSGEWTEEGDYCLTTDANGHLVFTSANTNLLDESSYWTLKVIPLTAGENYPDANCVALVEIINQDGYTLTIDKTTNKTATKQTKAENKISRFYVRKGTNDNITIAYYPIANNNTKVYALGQGDQDTANNTWEIVGQEIGATNSIVDSWKLVEISEKPISAADLNAELKDGFGLLFGPGKDKEYSNLSGAEAFSGKIKAVQAGTNPNQYYFVRTDGKYIVLSDDFIGEANATLDGTQDAIYRGYNFKAVSKHTFDTEINPNNAIFTVYYSYDFNDTDSLIVTLPLAGKVNAGTSYDQLGSLPTTGLRQGQECKGLRVFVASSRNDDFLTTIEYFKANDRLATQNHNAYANAQFGALAPYIQFGMTNLVNIEQFAGQVWNITDPDGNVLMPNVNWSNVDLFGEGFAPAEQVQLNKPEGHWLAYKTSDSDFGFINRESGVKWNLAGLGNWVIRHISGNTYSVYNNKYATSAIEGYTINITPVTDAELGWTEMGYARYDAAKEALNGKYLMLNDKVSGTVAYVGKDKDDNVILTPEQSEAIEFRIKELKHDYISHDGLAGVDTLQHVTQFIDIDKNGNYVYDAKDTLQFYHYRLFENFSEKYLTYDSKNQKFILEEMDVPTENNAHEDFNNGFSKDGSNISAFVLKEKNGQYNLISNYEVQYDKCKVSGGTHTEGTVDPYDKYDNDMYANLYGKYVEGEGLYPARKMYGAFLTATVANMSYIYNYQDNDRFTVKDIETPEYMTITGSQDTVKISAKDFTNFFLYEQNQNGTNFLGMNHVADVKDMKAAILADTAYVRNNTYRPQYLLAVGTDIKPEIPCEIPGHPTLHPDTVYGRFLVNMVDSAKAWTGSDKTNPYIWNKNSYYRLAFIDGYHTGDKLFLNTANAKTTIDLSNNNDKKCTFAFRYVDEERKGVKIETSYDGKNRGWLKYQNHFAVVTNDYDDADVFYVDNTTTDAPTANEEISAGNVVVAGVNGAVVVKGAEGKNVIVSTILGKVVANEVVSSDNATIAAPAGIVVVSVDGESFKVVVK